MPLPMTPAPSTATRRIGDGRIEADMAQTIAQPSPLCDRGGHVRLAAMSAATEIQESCASCYGQGEMPTDSGPIDCPDCGGTGRLPPRDVLVEWRLRAIEKAHVDRVDESSQGV